jgi:hypothetical protein
MTVRFDLGLNRMEKNLLRVGGALASLCRLLFYGFLYSSGSFGRIGGSSPTTGNVQIETYDTAPVTKIALGTFSP